MTVHFAGAMSEREFIDAAKAARGPGANPRFMLFAAIFFTLFAAALAVTPGMRPGAWMVLLVIVFPSALTWWSRSDLSLRRLYAKHDELRHHVDGSADSEGFTTGGPRYAWISLFRVLASPTFVLLYIQPTTSLIIPRSFFSSQPDWETFVGWAQTVVPKTPKRGAAIVKAVVLWLVIIAATIALYLWTR